MPTLLIGTTTPVPCGGAPSEAERIQASRAASVSTFARHTQTSANSTSAPALDSAASSGASAPRSSEQRTVGARARARAVRLLRDDAAAACAQTQRTERIATLGIDVLQCRGAERAGRRHGRAELDRVALEQTTIAGAQSASAHRRLSSSLAQRATSVAVAVVVVDVALLAATSAAPACAATSALAVVTKNIVISCILVGILLLAAAAAVVAAKATGVVVAEIERVAEDRLVVGQLVVRERVRELVLAAALACAGRRRHVLEQLQIDALHKRLLEPARLAQRLQRIAHVGDDAGVPAAPHLRNGARQRSSSGAR